VTRPDDADRAVELLLATASSWGGFEIASVPREPVRRVVRKELARGASVAQLLTRTAAGERELVRVLRSAISVGETYFFRNAAQFEAIAAHAPRLAATGMVRAWSAGCATGEEAWSLAATLVASAPSAQVIVRGTDIDESALAVARGGTYKLAAVRPSGPLLHPVFASTAGKLEVAKALRAITTFAVHDLREPGPGTFELIVCRNVMIYFTRAVARAVLEHLVAALAPTGLLVLGTMDIDPRDLVGLARVGPPELMVFEHGERRRRRTTRKPAARARPTTLPAEALALHRSALVWIEAGSRDSAVKMLSELNRKFPDYLPGILERALVHARKGEHVQGVEWMREVLRRAEALPPDGIVPGLDALPASFYRDTARVYLENRA